MSNETTAVAEENEMNIFKISQLREIVKGANGELIKLVDVQYAKDVLEKMATSFKGLEVNRDNYKKEAKDAERKLRQLRYDLQNIRNSNNDILNDAKKQEKKLFEDLIQIIKPVEEEVYNEIAKIEAIVKGEKEEEEAAAAAKKKAIEDNIKKVEIDFVNRIATAKTEADLEAYDNSLEELKKSFETFEELEFDAKRIHAIFTGRRAEIGTKLKSIKEAEEALIQAEKDKAAKEELNKKVLAFRIKSLEALGYARTAEIGKSVTMVQSGCKNFNEQDILGLDEVSWFEEIEAVKLNIEQKTEREAAAKAKEEAAAKAKEEAADKAAAESMEIIQKNWSLLIESYTELGGNKKDWKLKKGEIPTIEILSKLKSATEKLKVERKEKRAQEVKAEITPFVNEILDFFKTANIAIEDAEYKHSESKELLKSLLKEYSSKTNEVLGDAMSE